LSVCEFGREQANTERLERPEIKVYCHAFSMIMISSIALGKEGGDDLGGGIALSETVVCIHEWTHASVNVFSIDFARAQGWK